MRVAKLFSSHRNLPTSSFHLPCIPFFDGPGLPLAVDDGVVDEVVVGDRRVASRRHRTRRCWGLEAEEAERRGIMFLESHFLFKVVFLKFYPRLFSKKKKSSSGKTVPQHFAEWLLPRSKFVNYSVISLESVVLKCFSLSVFQYILPYFK